MACSMTIVLNIRVTRPIPPLPRLLPRLFLDPQQWESTRWTSMQAPRAMSTAIHWCLTIVPRWPAIQVCNQPFYFLHFTFFSISCCLTCCLTFVTTLTFNNLLILNQHFKFHFFIIFNFQDTHVSICRPTPTTEYDTLCGNKLCHIADDCRQDGGYDQIFFGFDVSEVGTQACTAHFGEAMKFYFLARAVYAAGNVWVATHVLQSTGTSTKGASTQRIRSKCCLYSVIVMMFFFMLLVVKIIALKTLSTFPVTTYDGFGIIQYLQQMLVVRPR